MYMSLDELSNQSLSPSTLYDSFNLDMETSVILDYFVGGNLLVLVDQHAAHERIRLEQLITGKIIHSKSGNLSKSIKKQVILYIDDMKLSFKQLEVINHERNAPNNYF